MESAPETRLRAILNTAVDAIITIDQRGIVDSVNDAVTRMFGYAPAELIGHNVSLLMPSPDRERHDGYLERYLKTGEKKIIGIGRAVEARRKDGTIFPVHLAVSELREGGEIRFAGIIRDITDIRKSEEALRESEKRFRSVVETAATVILILGPDRRVLEWNREAERVFGRTRAEVLGRDYFEFGLPPELHGPAGAELKRVLAGEHTQGYENDVLHRDGSRRRVLWNASRLLDEKGSVIGVVATGTDLTETRALEVQLQQVQRIETIGQLAGGIAHDFNNIVTGIAMSSDILIGRLAPDDPARELGAEIRSAAQRAKDLTRQLLNFSRAQVVDPKVLNLNELIQHQMESLLRRLIGEQVDLVLKMAPDLGNVKADPAQVQQVLMNLVVNARDAMPGGGMLLISTLNATVTPEQARRHLEIRPGSFVQLAVTDEGHGIDEKIRGRIFDPFFTTKGPDKGTGLGLSTVYAIVKRSGGFLEVESAPRRGTTFRVFLPRVAEAVAAAAPSAGVSTGERPLRILLVEDDAPIRRAVRTTLRERGHTVVEVADPLEAEGKCGDADLLITDVVMPKLNGVELARAIRLRRPEIAVLLMSGYAQDRSGGVAAPDPGSVFLQKPFTTDELMAKIAEAMRRR